MRVEAVTGPMPGTERSRFSVARQSGEDRITDPTPDASHAWSVIPGGARRPDRTHNP
jgi:hypothetical protein